MCVYWVEGGALDPVMAATLNFPWAASSTKPSWLTYHLHCSEAPPESAHLLLQLCQAVEDRGGEDNPSALDVRSQGWFRERVASSTLALSPKPT